MFTSALTLGKGLRLKAWGKGKQIESLSDEPRGGEREGRNCLKA